MLSILWHDGESAGYTDHIPLDWLSRNAHRFECVHEVAGPRSGGYKAKCNVNVRENIAEFDYRPFEAFNEAQGMLIGVMRVKFTGPRRDDVTQVSWKAKGKRTFAALSTTVTFVPGAQRDFEAMVVASSRLSSDERRKRLAVANRKPQRTRLVTTAFQRNPDVVAEVLFSAGGICEVCKKPAPFKRADSDIPYLEVHHRTRLADGGSDTIENAIAVCPNCHREAHYG
jgi:hypothetical protein